MIPRRDVWIAYLLMVCQGFLFYAVGYLTPYVESELGAPTWASALPNSAMAMGLLVAGVVVPRVVRGLGPWGAVRLWAVLLAAAALGMALATSLPVLLAGAFVIGLAGAGSLTHAVTAFAGRRNGVLLMRATLASVMGGVLGPLVLSAAARSVGWNLGILAPVPLALAVALLATAGRRKAGGDPAAADGGDLRPVAPAGHDHHAEPPLPRAYWLAWTFLVLCIGAESSFVAWGAQVAVAQVGIALADATALGSLFVLGLIIGRVLLGAGRGPRAEPKRLLAGMVVVGITGGLLVWVGREVALMGAGLLAGGLGLAGVWATAAGVAVANAPGSPVLAGARLNPASGVAMLVVPVLLGVVATAVGVLAAWGIVLGLLAVALVVLRAVPAGPAAPR
jgi:hypothetical protein